jgi:hypothetical protein
MGLDSVPGGSLGTAIRPVHTGVDPSLPPLAPITENHSESHRNMSDSSHPGPFLCMVLAAEPIVSGGTLAGGGCVMTGVCMLRVCIHVYVLEVHWHLGWVDAAPQPRPFMSFANAQTHTHTHTYIHIPRSATHSRHTHTHTHTHTDTGRETQNMPDTQHAHTHPPEGRTFEEHSSGVCVCVCPVYRRGPLFVCFPCRGGSVLCPISLGVGMAAYLSGDVVVWVIALLSLAEFPSVLFIAQHSGAELAIVGTEHHNSHPTVWSRVLVPRSR